MSTQIIHKRRVWELLPPGCRLVRTSTRRQGRVWVVKTSDTPASGSHSFLGRPNNARYRIGTMWALCWGRSLDELLAEMEPLIARRAR